MAQFSDYAYADVSFSNNKIPLFYEKQEIILVIFCLVQFDFVRSHIYLVQEMPLSFFHFDHTLTCVLLVVRGPATGY